MSHHRTLVMAVALTFSLTAVSTYGQLSLRVTVDTGQTEILNSGGADLAFDGYSVSSPLGQLTGLWSSLESQGILGWQAADTSGPMRLTEFNPTSSSTLGAGDSLLLGNVFAPADNQPADLGFEYTQPTGEVAVGAVDVSAALALTVDRGTGLVTLTNGTGGAVPLDGYTIASTNGQLGAGWTSFADRGVEGWDEADNSDANRVTEFNPTGSSAIAGGESVSLGSLFDPPPPAAIGDPIVEDISFQYTVPSGRILVGNVDYLGAVNNVVLTVDPNSGNATIQNQSPFFDLAIDAYSITSALGRLSPDTWNSLADQQIEGWDEADTSDMFRVTEFNPTSETALPGGGTILDLGSVLDVAEGIDLDDLNFQYLAAGGELRDGLILIGELSGCRVPPGAIPGDLDGNGTVAFADFLILSANFGQPVDQYELGDIDCDGTVAFADFLALSANFGLSAAEGAATASAVPEPGAAAMLTAIGLGALLHRRKRRA